MKKQAKKREKILSVLLYSLPILFFIVCYFLIITSGEDIWQGAKSNVDIIGDAIAAFNHSVRLADMFAWAVINFFDYHYMFGPDTIFRLLDVAAAFSIFYMTTYIALRRLPRLNLKDAATFAIIFLAVFLTSNGLTFYAGFSVIHNYLFITFFSLLFGIVYLRDLWGRKLPTSPLFILAMGVLGFIFGFASNVTAIVFLLSLPIYYIYLCIKEHQLVSIKSFIFSWRFAGVIGILLSVALMYIVGNGLGDYDTNPIYLVVCDYVPLAEIFEHPLESFGRIIWHNIYNFGRFLFPFIIASIPIGIYAFRKHLKPNLKALKKYQNYLVASGIFIFMHVFSMSQIIYPTRLMIPAYLFAVAIFCFVIKRLFFDKKIDQKLIQRSSFFFLFLISIIIVVRTALACAYLSRIIPILDEIKNTDAEVYCIDKETPIPESVPYLHLNQKDFLFDWAMPQTIYEKTITYCE